MSTPAPRTIVYTGEQQQVAQILRGGHIVCANAGTGKTEILSELFINIYEYEEARMFPGKGRVSGWDQTRVLKQIFAVTFTKKAAAEFDARIKTKFSQRGIPLPVEGEGTTWARPAVVCRTLDGWLQRWFKKSDLYFGAWMKTDRARGWLATVAAVERRMSPQLQSVLHKAANKNEKKPHPCFAYTVMTTWDLSITDTFQAMVLDALIAAQDHKLRQAPPWAGWSLAGWYRFLAEYTVPPDAARQLGREYWAPFLAAYAKSDHDFQQLRHRVEARQDRDSLSSDEVAERDIVRIEEERRQKRDQFLVLFELARSRGYVPGHPVPSFGSAVFTSDSFLEQFAASEAWKSDENFLGLIEFDRLARDYEAFKRTFLCMDYGDYLYEFIATHAAAKWVMEPAVEYPRQIRSKYVLWDEVQDNSPAQFLVLQAFTPLRQMRLDDGTMVPGPPFCKVIVGDQKQSIHAWRGADPWGFIKNIRHLKEKTPQNLHSLTTSFRSAQTIVALGNEIVSTLPSYKALVFPSSTIYKEVGEIRVAPLFSNQDEEAFWVAAAVREIVSKGLGSVMVLCRSEPHAHPVANQLKEFGENVSLMTIHRSKGLEADHVFVLGCTSGRIPSARGNSDQEINLWYVACTRPRRCLTLCAVLNQRVLGSDAEEWVGPSPFFELLPTLRSLALQAGWPVKALARGLVNHRQLVAQTLSALEKEVATLHLQADHIINSPDRPAVTVQEDHTYYVDGAAPPPAGVVRPLLDGPRSDAMAADPQRSAEAIAAETAKAAKVAIKLRKLFIQHPIEIKKSELDTESYQLAVSRGWLHQEDGCWRATKSFQAEHCRRGSGG